MRALTILIICLNAVVLKAQHDSSYTLSLHYANDVLNGTDRYFTQGLYLDLSLPETVQITPCHRITGRVFSSVRSSFRLRQDVFTPSTIFADTIRRGDRPYTATLTLSQHNTYTSSEKLFQLSGSLSIGIMGPSAMGRQMQDGVHKAIGNSLPEGWQHQLSDALMLQLEPAMNKALFSFDAIELAINAKARLGTVYNDIGSSLTLRFGNAPSLYKNSSKKVRYCLYLDHSLKYVGYNATLRGSMFSNDNIYSLPASDITKLVWSDQAGLEISAQNLCLKLTQTWISKEFSTGTRHSWNSITIGWRW